VPTWTEDPADLDPVELRLGETFRLPEISLEDEDGTAYSLTGVTGEAAIVDEPGGRVLLEPTPGGRVLLEPTVSIASDVITVSASAAAVAAATQLGRSTRARLHVRLTWPDGHVGTLLRALVVVRPAVFA
jgi:hypothetical protein